MELTPQLLTDEIDFRIAVRGYDRHEVDDFLERVAVAVGQLQSQLTKAVARARSAEARLAEIEAGGTAAATEGDAAGVAREAEESAVGVPATDVAERAEESGSGPVPKAPPSAPVPVIGGDDALNEELRRTLVLAQRTADTAIREAHEEAREILEQANDEARRNREAAEAAHAKAREEAHGRLVAEIRELEATRESMRSDTVVLERHLGTERARVRETIQVLRRLVEDPESFRTAPTPELSGATTPAALGAAPPASDVPADESATDEGPAGETPSGDEPSGDAPDAAAPDDAARAGGQAEASDEAPGGDGPGGAATDERDGADDAPDEGPATAPATTDPSGGEAEDGAAGATATAEEDEQPRAAADDDPPTGSAPAAEGDEADSERLGQLFGSADSTRDWRSSGPGRGDQGPHTQPVAAARFEEESDEAFLAELRRAMSDDEPLGPSETDR
jgi:DivIVA domain-containing protein